MKILKIYDVKKKYYVGHNHGVVKKCKKHDIGVIEPITFKDNAGEEVLIASKVTLTSDEIEFLYKNEPAIFDKVYEYLQMTKQSQYEFLATEL